MPHCNLQMVWDEEKLGVGGGGGERREEVVFADVTSLEIIRFKLWCHYVEASSDGERTNPDEMGNTEFSA